MTAAMNHDHEPPRQPRPPYDPDQAKLFDELRRQHGAPVCARRRQEFEEAERAVEIITTHGLPAAISEYPDANGTPTPIAAPIAEVQKWCLQCPFRQVCYDLITTGTTHYTGIAGGQIIHNSKTYKPRIERQATKKKKTSPPEQTAGDSSGQLRADDLPETQQWFSPAQLQEINAAEPPATDD